MSTIRTAETSTGKTTDCGKTQKPLTFLELIRSIRVVDGYTTREMAEISRSPQRTVDDWVRGKAVPSNERQRQFFNAMKSPTAPLSKRKLRQNHLSWDKSKKRWLLRVTVDLKKKKIGQRVTVLLKTRDARVAMGQRDAIIAGYRELGLIVRLRDQKRKGNTALGGVILVDQP